MTRRRARLSSLALAVLFGAAGRAVVELGRVAMGRAPAVVDETSARSASHSDSGQPSAPRELAAPPDARRANPAFSSDARRVSPVAGDGMPSAERAAERAAEDEPRRIEARALGIERAYLRARGPAVVRPIGVPRDEYRAWIGRSSQVLEEDALAILRDAPADRRAMAGVSLALGLRQFRFVALRVGSSFEVYFGSDASPASTDPSFWIREAAGRAGRRLPLDPLMEARAMDVAVALHVAIDEVRREFARDALGWLDSGAAAVDADVVAVCSDLRGRLWVFRRGEDARLDEALLDLGTAEAGVWARFGPR